MNFKAKATREMFVNGVLIRKVWRRFEDETLFKTCMNFKEISLLVEENKNWTDPKTTPEILEEAVLRNVALKKEQEEEEKREKEIKERNLKLFVETATVSDLKDKLMEFGCNKKDISDLNKSDLINMVLSF